MNKRPTVELRPAFAWDCPECGREQFARAVVPEFSPEDLEELRTDHGVQPWETGEFLLPPGEVTCPHCDTSFSTVAFNADAEPE